MGLFSSSKGNVIQSPIAEMVDSSPSYALNGCGANLFVYDKFVVIDHTKGGLMNLGNRTYKVIPVKNIMAVQVKSTGATTGFIEISTPGHDFTEQRGFDRAHDENTINFSSDEAIQAATDIVKFLLPRIV